jgi:hypothetical protein
MPHKPSRISWKLCASQVARLGGAIIAQRFLGKLIELTRLDILLQDLIEAFSVELLEPCTKPGQFVRRKSLDRLLDIFRCHGSNIAMQEGSEKVGGS